MKQRQWLVLGILGSMLLFAACKEIRRVSRTSYIIDADNIDKVDSTNVSSIPAKVLNASVLITTYLQDKKIKFCSGTLIAPAIEGGNMRVLTNHHCFAKAGADGQSTSTVFFEACTNTTVYFGFVPGVRSELLTQNCEEGTLRSHYEADVAVFTLSQNPPERFAPLELWEGEDPVDRNALIVHYPDKEEHLTKVPGYAVKLPAAATTINDCQVFGSFPVSEWELDQTLPFSLRHTCDLIHGSSGSGLIDAETNKILGVNWGGIKITYPDGVRTDNVATKASFIRSFLADQAEVEVQRVTEEKNNHLANAKKKEKENAGGFGDALKAGNCGVIGGKDTPAVGAFLLILLGILPVFWQPQTAPAKSRRYRISQ